MRKWSFRIGLTLAVAFVVAAYLMFWHFRGRFQKNDDQLALLADAEFVAPPPLQSSHWPQWRGEQRDGRGSPVRTFGDWPANRKPDWSATVGVGYGAPVVVDAVVYLHAQQSEADVIRALRASDGKEIWSQTAPPSGSFEHSRGPNSTPCVADDHLYTVSLVGLVQCRKCADGALVWEQDLEVAYGAKPPRWGTSFSPLVVGRSLILNPGAAGAAVVAVDCKTGEEIWRSGSDPAGYSSPLIATVAGQKLVFMFTGTALTALRLDTGKEVLRQPWPTNFQVNPAMPIVFQTRQGETVRDYVFLTSGYNQGCGLFHLRPRDDGTLVADTVYTGDNFCSHYGSPVRVGDHVYGFNEADLQALNLRTGQVRWKVAGYKKGSLCALGDNLLVLGEEGKLAHGKASPEAGEFTPLTSLPTGSRFDTIKVRYWTMPVVANGALYVRSGDKVLCYRLETTAGR